MADSSPFGSMFPAMQSASGSGGMQSLNLPGVQTQGVNPKSLQTDPSQVYSLLSQSPQSLTSILGPLMQQIYGMQGNMMQPIFQQQGAQGAAIAQSDAMKRGLTGSSIEQQGIQQAYGQANQGFDQYMAQILGQVVPQYSQAAQFDIGNQNQYYGNLAQAVGQNYSSQIQQQQFQQQLQAGLQEASQQANAQMWAGIAGGLGSLGGGAISKFSDIRLKKDIERLGYWRGLGVYRFFFKDRSDIELPKSLQVGFMAHEVAKKHPAAVEVSKGYLKVNIAKLLLLEAACA